MVEPASPTRDDATTQRWAAWCRDLAQPAADPWVSARTIATWLGAHRVGEAAVFGFWAPELAEHGADKAFLELLIPESGPDPAANRQHVSFRRHLVAAEIAGDFAWIAVTNVPFGTRERCGAFYQLVYRDRHGAWGWIPDYVAYSVPFGPFARAELYDRQALDAARADRRYFQALATADADVPRFGPPTNILQVHPGTASPSGTLAGLARIYESIGAKLAAGRSLAPEEEPFTGYDALQLMPVEPTVAYEAGPAFWQTVAGADPEAERVEADLARPDTTNWGYDVVIQASSAPNPALLETGRPDELADLAATLHNFPAGPIKLIVDIVFGHADNQALGVLSRHFFAGPNMYGQNLAYRNPVVRALLLEMQRRKVDFGADGVRVDGAQDFEYYDPQSGQMIHDDDYLQAMSDIVQETAGQRWQPWMIFEDGRPWPRGDWELASSYRSVIAQQPHVFQWGPLTFAHNTPFLYTFWISKWWRMREIRDRGGQWISGSANHDTLRRGSQVDPGARINRRLGDSLPEILGEAYDNPAANLLFYGLAPGIPMEFLQAAMHTPWSFVRNTDSRYAVKVAAEEAGFLDWQVTPELFDRGGIFPRVKALGLTELGELRRFARTLESAVHLTDYDLEAMVDVLAALRPPFALTQPLTTAALQAFAHAWMADVGELCTVTADPGQVDPARTAYNRALRAIRRNRPWLRDSLGAGDWLTHRHPAEGTVLYYGERTSPDGTETLRLVANMEGAPATVGPNLLGTQRSTNNAHQDWEVLLATPALAARGVAPDLPITLHDSEGLLMVRPGGA